MKYLNLLRPKHWVKNLFLFIPLFFAGEIFNFEKIISLIYGFVAFSFIASSIYIFNDYRDLENDAKHPIKKLRPMAAGAITPTAGLMIAILLALTGFTLAFLIRDKFLFILLIYFLMNLSYSFGLKNIPIVDVIIIAVGFVLRIKAGAAISRTWVSEWLILMIFLLSLFLALGKRRDDVMIQAKSGIGMRKSINGYNLEYLNVMISLVCSVIIVSYLMYSISPEIQIKLGTSRLYYSSLFVIAGLMRYLQLIFVKDDSGYPTYVLYKDRFIQITLILWIASFFFLIYVKEISFFNP